MEVFLECCMTLFFSAAMLLLIVRLAKGEEKNMIPSAGTQGLFLFQTKVHKILYAFQKLPDQLFCRRVLVLTRVDDKTDFTFGGLLDERNPTDGTAL